MRWRTSGVINERQIDTSRGHDNDKPLMSSSMDEDEPDSSSQDPVHSDEGSSKDPHGRLGFSESDLPPSAGHIFESEKQLEEEKKQLDDKRTEKKPQNESDPDGPSGKEEDTVIEDDDGLDHSQPPDDGAETDTPSIPWRPQNSQSTCEFTHTIDNYSQKRESGCKKAEYSATTVDEFGNRWRLIVYVNGNGRASNHHLSLFLQVADADDLPFGWKKAVSYVLTLEHPSGANLSYAKRNPDKTFKLCPKAIDWGWSQFITSDRIQQEGFVSNDSLTVRASVTVKSSSVSIDSEDAELYLKCAVEEGGAEAVKLCLSQGASVNCKFKDDLYTPLHTACSSGTNGGSMEVLNLLLERGADGNACNKWRETPLLIAANNGHRAAVEALLMHGADPSLCSEAGWSALTFAAHKGYDDIVALLLRAGAPVNCRVTEDSSTPLHKACAGAKHGHLSAVKQLLDGGADVHALNKWRETPLLTAANHGQAGAVDALLKAGADPCKCTDTGWSPLSIAAYKGHDNVVRLLLEEGAPTEEADPTLSALLQAATKGLPDTVELLLRHGADHTVTTKKGDTALSILVEQNLIDAAVEMVTEYKASVPRCSRDRKKVQRARLLINLRMKQHQREGKLLTVSTDDGDTDEEESEDNKSAQHDEGLGPTAVTPRGKKKDKSPKPSAEEQARAAEEALLLELEQEDAKAKKEEADANSKRAKKRKKKERERQQKMKEEQERRLKAEKEAEEKERTRKEKEERDRKEREERLRQQREREMKEAAEREKIAAARKKEREREEKEKQQRELERRHRENQDRVEKKTSTPSASYTPAEKRVKPKPKGNKKQLPAALGSDRNGVAESSVHAGDSKNLTSNRVGVASPVMRSSGQSKSRGWETTNASTPSKPKQSMARPSPSNQTPVKSSARSLDANHTAIPGKTQVSSTVAMPSTFRSQQNDDSAGTQRTNNYLQFDQPQNAAASGSMFPSTQKVSGAVSPLAQDLNFLPSAAPPVHFKADDIEHPAVGLFRHEKVTELLQRCRLAFNVMDELVIKKVIYRWIVRAAHSHAPYFDCIIPSWEFEQLSAYFQRQFIAESRKGINVSSAGSEMVNMETLREAGTSMAVMCQACAKEVVQFRHRMEEQMARDWVDSTVGISASEVRNGSGSGVVLDWANRSQLFLSAAEIQSLQTRYVSQHTRFLTTVFSAKLRYETLRMILIDTTLDYRLPQATKASLSMEVGVSGELWSDPFSTFSSSVFWGTFEDVDSPFGGMKPFGKDDGRGEELLTRHGGSVVVLLPLDNIVSSRYAHRMLDILEKSQAEMIPVSFAVFVREECFHDLAGQPSIEDLHLLDPRLGEHRSVYLRRFEALPAGHHAYVSGDGVGMSAICSTGSLFLLLQNDAGRACFDANEVSISKIIHTMSIKVSNLPGNDLSLVTSIGFGAEYTQKESPVTPQTGYFDPVQSVPSELKPSGTADFGVIGGSSLSNAFSPSEARRAPRRGRLFDLVDVEDDNIEEVDVVSGMLNTLNVDLFQNNSTQDVDIEAISLMGIGSDPTRPLQPSQSHSKGRFS